MNILHRTADLPPAVDAKIVTYFKTVLKVTLKPRTKVKTRSLTLSRDRNDYEAIGFTDADKVALRASCHGFTAIARPENASQVVQMLEARCKEAELKASVYSTAQGAPEGYVRVVALPVRLPF